MEVEAFMSKSVQISEKRSYCKGPSIVSRELWSLSDPSQKNWMERPCLLEDKDYPPFCIWLMKHRTKSLKAGFYSHFLIHFITLKSSQILGRSCLITEELVINKIHLRRFLLYFRWPRIFLDIYSTPNLVLSLKLWGQFYFFYWLMFSIIKKMTWYYIRVTRKKGIFPSTWL